MAVSFLSLSAKVLRYKETTTVPYLQPQKAKIIWCLHFSVKIILNTVVNNRFHRVGIRYINQL